MKLRVAVPCSTVFPGPANALSAVCDLIERRRPQVDGLEGYAEVFHWSEGIFSERFFPELERLGLPGFLSARGIREFSFDLGPACGRVHTLREGWGEYYLPASSVLSLPELSRVLQERAARLREIYSGRIAVELLAYYPTAAYAEICMPSAVARLLESSDLLLLLDLAHAEVSARNLGMTLANYLEALPLERLSHLHLSRPDYVANAALPEALRSEGRAGLAVDAHGLPLLDDFETALKLASRSAQPEVFVAIEHYADVAGLVQSYDRLKSYVEDWNSKCAKN